MQNVSQSSWWSKSWWSSFYSSISTKIAENLQLEIKDVHIRYEYNQNEKISFGVKIGSLTAQSTNQDWVSQYLKRFQVQCQESSNTTAIP